MRKARLFIASSSSEIGLKIANTLQATLGEKYDIATWKQDTFVPGEYILDGLVGNMANSDFGVFVFHPDDSLTIRDENLRCVRDNVVFELGLFIGGFGRKRTFIVSPLNPAGIRQISDLEGVLRITYDEAQLAINEKAALGSACREIQRAVDALGVRDHSGEGSFYDEVLRRLQKSGQRSAPVSIENTVVLEQFYGESRLAVVVDDLLNEQTDIIVSSDDTSLTASGGVAKKILERGGLTLGRELQVRRMVEYEAGELAVTSGGDLPYRAILHAITLDLKLRRWPRPETVELLTRRALRTAESIGARSVSLPLLGSGTAGQQLSEADSMLAIVGEVDLFFSTRSTELQKLKNIHVCCLKTPDPGTVEQARNMFRGQK